MTLTKTQVERLLALHPLWQQKLCAQEGAGYWCRIEADGQLCMKLYEGPTGYGSHYTLADGWVWAPCDSAAWVNTASRAWARRTTPRGPCYHIPDGTWHLTAANTNAVDCALDFMEKVAPETDKQREAREHRERRKAEIHHYQEDSDE